MFSPMSLAATTSPWIDAMPSLKTARRRRKPSRQAEKQEEFRERIRALNASRKEAQSHYLARFGDPSTARRLALLEVPHFGSSQGISFADAMRRR